MSEQQTRIMQNLSVSFTANEHTIAELIVDTLRERAADICVLPTTAVMSDETLETVNGQRWRQFLFDVTAGVLGGVGTPAHFIEVTFTVFEKGWYQVTYRLKINPLVPDKK